MCVFYDQVGSPIRLVQRMGRTARKRAGRVVLLMGPGEDRKFEAGGEKSARQRPCAI
ncbi:helicase [Aureococcus anophagefferens]|nr:helicase [Aureococcus anophagefferens]